MRHEIISFFCIVRRFCPSVPLKATNGVTAKQEAPISQRVRRSQSAVKMLKKAYLREFVRISCYECVSQDKIVRPLMFGCSTISATISQNR